MVKIEFDRIFWSATQHCGWFHLLLLSQNDRNMPLVGGYVSIFFLCAVPPPQLEICRARRIFRGMDTNGEMGGVSSLPTRETIFKGEKMNFKRYLYSGEYGKLTRCKIKENSISERFLENVSRWYLTYIKCLSVPNINDGKYCKMTLRQISPAKF